MLRISAAERQPGEIASPLPAPTGLPRRSSFPAGGQLEGRHHPRLSVGLSVDHAVDPFLEVSIALAQTEEQELPAALALQLVFPRDLIEGSAP